MGKYIYCQWLVPIYHYYKIIKRNEFIYEVIVPIVVSCIVMLCYAHEGLTASALLKMRELLPNALAVLIGFTVMCITLIATTDSNNISEIRNKKSKRIIGNHIISMFRWLLIIFSYSLIVEVFLLIYVFFVAFVMGLNKYIYLLDGLLVVEAF